MKNLYLRSSLVLACALGLAACGGDDDGNLQLAGSVYGVSATGLVLQNNGAWDTPIEPGTTFFAFKELIGSDTAFNVTIKSNPSNATCEIRNGKGKTGAYSISSIEVLCTVIPHNLGGKITGLTVPGLIINNGPDRLSIPANATTFSMTIRNEKNEPVSGQVGQSQPYGITIFQQPTGRTCTVTNGTGTMGTVDIDNVQITCV